MQTVKMRSFIITGDSVERLRYIEEFAATENIPSHSITVYSDEIKIIEAKAIRKDLSNKYSTKRLIVIDAKINLVAQNLLLKSFEELSDNVSVILSQQDLSEIIDTIKSRFFIVKLGIPDAGDLGVQLDGILSDDLPQRLLAIDSFLNSNKDVSSGQQMDIFIQSYRKALMKVLDSNDRVALKKHTGILRKLLDVSNFVKFNNLNIRLGLESAIL